MRYQRNRKQRYKVGGALRRLLFSSDGGVLALYGLALPVMLGLGGLATDIGLWYGSQRTAQSIADSAAIAAALESARGETEETAIQAAEDDAAQNGFDDAYGTITISSPASTGPFKDQAGTAEAVVQVNVQGFLASVIFGDSPAVAARAVARTTPDTKCVWVLDPAEPGSLTYAGSTTIDLECGAAVKSNDPEAIDSNGGACLSATEIEVVGGSIGSCISPEPMTGVPTESITDPLSYMPPPSYGACDYGDLTYNTVDTMSPGVYCGRTRVLSGGIVTMDPGVYVFDNNAEFRVAAAGTLIGNGVMIYFTDDADQVFFAGGANIDLIAPTSGAYKGILFYMDRNGDPTKIHWLTGGITMQLDGTIYAPTQNIQFAGGSVADTVNANLICRTLKFVGNSEVGLAPATIIPAALLDPVLIE